MRRQGKYNRKCGGKENTIGNAEVRIKYNSKCGGKEKYNRNCGGKENTIGIAE